MQLTDIIKYEGDNQTFIWKHPSEDFNSFTQLIVHESQEAIFFMNGQALDLFGPGRYTLDTQNIPILSGLLNRATGGESPFHCEVYFINKTEQMALKWGTNSKIQFMEPTYQFPIEIGACGEMSLRAEDSRKLLLKLVGTESVLDREQLVAYFRAFLMTRVKAYLARIIREEKISIFEIDEHLTEISTALKERLCPDFLDYGVALERFFVTTIVKPDGEAAYEKFKSLHFRQYADVAEAKLRQTVGIIEQQTQAQKLVIESQAIAAKRAQEGYTYQQERGFDVAEHMADNEAVGQMTNLGVGLGTMAGVGGAVGGLVGGAMGSAVEGMNLNVPATPAGAAVCAKCGAKLPPGAKFCLECGEKVQSAAALTVCPACGKEVAAGKFCPQCGSPLTLTCPKCGAALIPGAKFCPECGEKL